MYKKLVKGMMQAWVAVFRVYQHLPLAPNILRSGTIARWRILLSHPIAQLSKSGTSSEIF